ncbi:hypothetical protein CI610_03193 [invertebrate metagenome]|uniref:Uncharacterized protein n=1 Tax=invertebrate metagenome TaxID=1711999 RepID=A0A2H9T3U1_9ZZZZ
MDPCQMEIQSRGRGAAQDSFVVNLPVLRYPWRDTWLAASTAVILWNCVKK